MSCAFPKFLLKAVRELGPSLQTACKPEDELDGYGRHREPTSLLEDACASALPCRVIGNDPYIGVLTIIFQKLRIHIVRAQRIPDNNVDL